MKEYSYGIAPYKIINNDIFLLVSKSSKNSLYGFIKGKKEVGESIKKCIMRETFEETSLFVNQKHFEHFFYQQSPRKNIGIYTIDSFNIDLHHLSLNYELYEVSFKKLDINLYNNFLNNQKIILNNLFLYFKNKEKFHIKNKFHIKK